MILQLQLQHLMQKGFIEILQKVDDNGVLYEIINLMPLWKRLVDFARMHAETNKWKKILS